MGKTKLLEKLSSQNRIRGHKFINAEIIENAEKIGRQEWKNAEIIVKYFLPWSGWTWYITEIDSEWIAYWYTVGGESEWGSVSLVELETLNTKWMVVERDLFFIDKKIKDIL